MFLLELYGITINEISRGSGIMLCWFLLYVTIFIDGYLQNRQVIMLRDIGDMLVLNAAQQYTNSPGVTYKPRCHLKWEIETFLDEETQS